MNLLINITKTLRPWQWIKNILVFTVFIGAGLNDINYFFKLLICFFAISLMASAGYVINDLIDEKRDRSHPIKKMRPIASGSISKLQSRIILTTCIFLSSIMFSQINLSVVILGFIYLLLSITYTFKFKLIKFVDSLSISSMFLLRAFIGSEAVNISISKYLFLFIFSSSFMLALGKKISIKSNSEIKNDYKTYLEKSYSTGLLVGLYKLFMGCSVFVYGSWLFNKFEVYGYVEITLIVIIIFSVYFVFNIILQNSMSAKMEDISIEMFKNKKITANILIILVVSIFAIYINN